MVMSDILRKKLSSAIGTEKSKYFSKLNNHLRSNKSQQITQDDFYLLMAEIAHNSPLKMAKIVLYNFLVKDNKI